MPTKRVRLAILFLAALAVALTQTRQVTDVRPESKGRWYKGNLHTHTVNSDGDSTPQEVTSWYREHGYHFLVLSDHNHLTDIAGLNALHAAREKFLLIPGEEVTDRYAAKHIHINAYDLDTEVQPQHGASVVATIQNNVNAIRAVKGMPSVNHPNFHWSITAEDLLQVNNLGLFEVYNGHPTVNNAGGGGFKSLDEMWDVLLTAGRRIHGIAVDDAHHFKSIGLKYSNPGRGWISVRAASLSRVNIMNAIAQGDFYSSSGVQLLDVQTSPQNYRIDIDVRETERFTTTFYGDGGRVLARSYDASPVYQLKEADKYVRARVDSSFGVSAWTQPVFR